MMFLYIGIAGFIGAVLRYSLGIVLFNESFLFPYATLTANLIGSYLLSWLLTRSGLSSFQKTAVGTGLIGSFTTFSTFSVETVSLFENGYMLTAIIYVLVSIIGGIFMSRLGFRTVEGDTAK